MEPTKKLRNELAGMFKILALLANVGNIQNVSTVLLKLSAVVFEGEMLDEAKCCVLEGDKYLSRSPCSKIFHHVGEQLLLIGLKIYRVQNQVLLPLKNNKKNYVLFWLENVKTLELINELQMLLSRYWNSKKANESNDLFSKTNLCKQKCLQDCIYLFQRLSSSSSLPMHNNNSEHFISILPKTMLNEVQSMLNCALINQDDISLQCLLLNCSQWKMNTKANFIFLSILNSLCKSHRYKPMIVTSKLVLICLFDNLLLSLKDDGKKCEIRTGNKSHEPTCYFSIILKIIISHPTSKIYLDCNCEKYLMQLMTGCYQTIVSNDYNNVPEIKSLATQIYKFISSILFVYQDAMSKNIKIAWKSLYLKFVKNNISPLLSIGTQIDNCREFYWESCHSNNHRVGLQNLGNTCYMNSILQILFLTDPFSNAILSIDLLDLQKNISGLTLIRGLKYIFALLTFTHRPCVVDAPITNFRKELRSPFNNFRQQDASEFCYSLLDDVITRCNLDGVKDIFSGKIETNITCNICNTKSVTNAPFLGLQLPFSSAMTNNVPNNNDNYSSSNPSYKISVLLNHYFKPEILEKGNAYFCERCNKKAIASKQTKIIRAPEILVLTVKRFYYDTAGTISGKIKCPLQIEPSLNVNNESFDLFGVVTHHGDSLNSGHYTATASHSNSPNSCWWHFDDSRVERLNSRGVQNIKNAYILFYKKKRVVAETTVTPFYTKSISPDILEKIRYDNCMHMLELHTSAKRKITRDLHTKNTKKDDSIDLK